MDSNPDFLYFIPSALSALLHKWVCRYLDERHLTQLSMPNICSNLSVYPTSSQLSFQLGFIILLQMRNGGTHEKLT